jgi:hypothetical protein
MFFKELLLQRFERYFIVSKHMFLRGTVVEMEQLSLCKTSVLTQTEQ